MTETPITPTRNAIIQKAIIYEELQKYSNHTPIYTDGSKTPEGCGCAIVTPTKNIAFNLPQEFTVFSCEAYAILQAMKYIKAENQKKTIILTDSRSALQAIKNLNPTNPWIREIIEELTTLKSNTQNEILFMWLPAHVGIAGNEKADLIAKSATTLEPQHQATVYHKETIQKFIEALKKSWNNTWKNLKQSKIHTVRDNIYDKNPALTFNRREQTAITRLRIGHTNLTHTL